MFIYYASIIRVIDTIDQGCRLVLDEIDNLENPSALDFSERLINLRKYAEEKLTHPMLVNAPKTTDLLRHLAYAVHFSTKKPSISWIESNLRDVVLSDAPSIREGLAEYMESFIDVKLLEATRSRLQNSDYLGAVRAAFPLFSQRMRASFGIDPSIRDGAKLIDTVFGAATPVKYRTGVLLSDREKQSFNSLTKGLYQLVRNEAAHEHDSITFEQADATLSTLNYVLRTIDM